MQLSPPPNCIGSYIDTLFPSDRYVQVGSQSAIGRCSEISESIDGQETLHLSVPRAKYPQQDSPARSSGIQQKRFLSIHEYLSANLLKTVRSPPSPDRPTAYNWQYGIGVPNGEVARSAAEAETIAKQIGMTQGDEHWF